MQDYVHSGLKMVNKKKEGVYKNTKGIGLWTYWYPNGNIEREGYRNNGVKSGYWMYFYDTGGKKAKEFILMTLNMDYGLFGTEMELNNLKVISKRI